MKTARLLLIPLFASLGLLALMTVPVSAQSIPEVPTNPGPCLAVPAIEPAAVWSAGSPVVLLSLPFANPLAPLAPVWLPALGTGRVGPWTHAATEPRRTAVTWRSGRAARPAAR